MFADELDLSPRTVESHVAALFEVFGVKSKTALVTSALRLEIFQK